MRIEELLAGIINLAVHMLRTPMYLLLEEKQMLVKVLGSGLLMDSETCQINNAKLNDKKRIRHANIHRIFKNLEVFTLFGDMQINYIKRSKNYEASRWPLYGATSSSSLKLTLWSASRRSVKIMSSSLDPLQWWGILHYLIVIIILVDFFLLGNKNL